MLRTKGQLGMTVLVFAGAAVLFGDGATALQAQEPNPMSQQAPASDNKITKESEGVYLYRIKVVQRDLDAVNYLHRSGSTTIAFKGTPLLPLAKGEAKVESERGGITIEARFEGLTPANGFGKEYLTYVLWAITSDGRPNNLGEVLPSGAKGKNDITVTTPLQYLPQHPTLENYVDAWTSPVTPFSRFFLNSLWVCSVTMVATTVVSVLAGYAIARFRFAGRDALLLIFLATQMFPSVLLIAPLLTQWRALGLIDTYQALIYSNFSFTVPFTVWMMVGYFSSIPRDLEESAMIDGCNHFGALCRVVLPLAAPGIAATAIFAFVVSWSELLFAISFTTETDMRTLSAGLLYMVGQYEVQWGPLSAGVIMSTVPVAVLFVFLQRHLIHGLTAGAVKG
jgi:multiple sugar transport system permease protein